MANCTVEIRGVNDAEAKAISQKIATLLKWSGHHGKLIEVWEIDPKAPCFSRKLYDNRT